jgi:hypothetical protein
MPRIVLDASVTHWRTASENDWSETPTSSMTFSTPRSTCSSAMPLPPTVVMDADDPAPDHAANRESSEPREGGPPVASLPVGSGSFRLALVLTDPLPRWKDGAMTRGRRTAWRG